MAAVAAGAGMRAVAGRDALDEFRRRLADVVDLDEAVAGQRHQQPVAGGGEVDVGRFL